MNRYVAFLRGMNLGRRRIKNDELCTAFVEMGYTNVAAFLASGNVIFDADETDTASITNQVETGLRNALDYDVPTFVRTADEVRAIAAYAAFSNVHDGNHARIQVAMFSSEIGDATRAAVLKLSNEDDRLELASRELYWMPKGNLMDTELDLRAVEELVGVMTIRTKRTIERLVTRFMSQ